MSNILAVYLAVSEPKPPPEKQRPDFGALISIALAMSPAFFNKDKSEGKKQLNSGSAVNVQVNNYSHNQNTNTNTNAVTLNNDYSWVKRIVKQPFRMITGGQGSGKSTQERYWINLLKTQGWYVICVNPNTTPQSWKGIEVIQEVSAINEFLENFPKWVESRQNEARTQGIDEDKYLGIVSSRHGKKGRVAIFFMEANQFELKDVEPEVWAAALKTSLTDIRKWGFTVCLTCQAGKQSTISSKLKGFADNLKDAPQIECIATTNSEGDAISSGEGILKLPGQKPQRIALPNYSESKDFRTNEQRTVDSRSTTAGENSSVGNISRDDNNDKKLQSAKTPAPKTDREILALKICKSLAGKGKVKASRLASLCNALRNYLESKFGGTSFDNPELVKEVHIILEIAVMQEKGIIYGDRDKSGLIILSKNNEFEAIN